MAKLKKAYFCRECGFEAPKWLGRCPACGEWNTFTEEVISKPTTAVASVLPATQSVPQRVGEIKPATHQRLDMCNAEVNRVLGGGLVPGSLVLLGGEPGIGKSTLSLQLALTSHGLRTLYVSGEESAEQIGMRAERLGVGNEECYIYAETLLENILQQIEQQKPDVVVIDSIQTIYTQTIESSAGSVSQIRECAASLLKYAKTTNTSIFIIGHITKDGTIAGPKILEHIVDVVLQFEGDGNNVYRILRGIKNRFGATFEIGVFEMLDNGLRAVENPSEILLSHYEEPLSGIAVGASVDGVRPYLIEVQALVTNAAYGTPQRNATGYDSRRMSMLLAVLEGVAFALKDNLEQMRLAGADVRESLLTGGGAKSPLWQKIIAAVLNIPLLLPVAEEGPAMGGARLAIAACGGADSLPTCPLRARVEPDADLARKYEEKYRKFRALYPALKNVFKDLK